MSPTAPDNAMKATCTIGELARLQDLEHRRLYLYGSLYDIDSCEDSLRVSSVACALAEHIMEINRIDIANKATDPEPIRLYINSPGGDVTEGFALIDAISLSKTPVWTINVGQCSSMAFLVCITGHKRFSFPSASFLMHDGMLGAIDSSNKMQDRIKFEMRYEREVVRKHILSHGKMSKKEYDKLARVELYMLPQEALRYGFIDEIVTDLSVIL